MYSVSQLYFLCLSYYGEKSKLEGLGCGLMLQDLPSLLKALDSRLSTSNKRRWAVNLGSFRILRARASCYYQWVPLLPACESEAAGPGTPWTDRTCPLLEHQVA